MPKRFIIVDHLRAAGRRPDAALDGIPVAVPTPTLSWIVTGPDGWTPEHAELELERGAGPRETATVVDGTGVDVPWPFAPLAVDDIATLRVRAHGGSATSEWAQVPLVATFRPGWRAEYVGGADDDRPVRLRVEFDVPAPVRRATLRLSALGAVRAELDGARVGDDELAPGWTSYRHRVLFDTHDVTERLTPGRHALGLELAGAWFTESYGFGDDHRRVYGDAPAASVELDLVAEDGTVTTVVTGPDWRATDTGPLRASGIYAGEERDARREQPGWSRPGYDDTDWSPVRVHVPPPTPTARTAPPVRRLLELPVREVLATPSGGTVLDFGQNLVGRVRLAARGARGSTVRVHHAEVLEHGELALRPLRRAAATDTLVLAGEAVETWEPSFTFHGFRYVEVETAGGAVVDPAEIFAVVLGTELDRIGEFACSEPRLERLHENIVWSARGNFLSVPTDCPQRDERLGWTGDVQVFAPTASFLFDVEAFLDSWLDDVALEQAEHDGVVPVVVPWVLDWDVVEVAAWGDVATVLPWVLYERLGSTSLLARRYPGMRDWCEPLLVRAGAGLSIAGGFQFGDWLDPAAPPDDPFASRTPHDLVANAYLVRSLDLTARAAEVLERPADASRYRIAARGARAAFALRFLAPDGRLAGDAPTAYALSLGFDLLPEHRDALGARLAELVRRDGHRIGTGFVGTPLVLDALVDTGHADDAIELLLQTESPSWLSPVTRGATTMWERWDSLLEDGTVNPGEMTSFNHYALGAVADFLHRRLAGLAPAAPGYRELRIAPLVTPRLTHASARLRTPYGAAASGWRRADDGVLTVHATVPTGTRAHVELPDGRRLLVEAGSHDWTL
jgi:alpha-L-rhamnosidase